MPKPREAKLKPNEGTGATPVPRPLLKTLALRPPDFRALMASWADPVARRKGMAIYEEMLLDPMVAASLDLLKYAALSLGWSVSPGEDSRKGRMVAEEVQEILQNFPGGFTEFLYAISSAIEYGYSITELIWETSERLWVPKAWVPLPQPLYGFRLDEETGRPIAVVPLIRQLEGQDYPLEGFVIMVWNSRFGSPYGRSQLVRAYEAWWIKQLLRRMRNTTLDRYGAPLLAVRVPPNTPEEDREKLKAFLENLHAEAGLVMNNTTEILPIHQGGGTSSAEGFQRAIEYEDAQIAKAIMGTVLNANESRGTGTYAQARVHQDNFLYWVGRVTRALEATVNDQVIRRYVSYNYSDVLPPRMKFDPPEAEDLNLAASVINSAFALGVVVPQLEADWIRAKLGLPPVSEEVQKHLKGQVAGGSTPPQEPDDLSDLWEALLSGGGEVRESGVE